MATELPRAEVAILWYQQGGRATYEAYGLIGKEQLRRHFKTFFCRATALFRGQSRQLYVHGGYDPTQPVAKQEPDDLIWNRTLWRNGMQAQAYTECFIGHTPT